MPLVLLAGLSLVTSVERAGAHDFWIEPSSFRPGHGQAISIDLKVGEMFVGDSIPRRSEAIERFSVVEADRTVPVAGSEGVVPAGMASPAAGQPAIVVYDGGGGTTSLDAVRFEAYLRAHGLEWVVEGRARAGETDRPVRERFRRHAKALLGHGGQASIFGMVLDQTLELVPVGDPTRAGPSQVELMVRWRGAPLVGCLVLARSRDNPAKALSARSDAQGHLTLPLGHGIWLLQAVWMERGGWFSDADWHSEWASLTFLKAGGQ
ncbi:DUF4198 domain-containing protein [Neorhizobium sp. NPDC001467]|uniref:DUF4198 domain-containing protein n=1 Tax=Neorhizobium sp. NPDC001467 TaxID=3390595 RepID=UPI003CFD4703